MQAANRVAKNTLILYARMGITMFVSLYSTRLILAALGVADFGIFNVVGGAIAMLTFLNTAMASATQRFMSYAQGEGNYHKQKNIFNVSVLLHFFIGLALILLLEIAGYFLFNGILKIDSERIDAAKLIYQFLIASTFFTIISVPYDAVINAHENMLFVALLGIFEAVLKLSIAFYVTYTGFDKLASYGLLMASLAVLLLIIRRVYCHKKYEEVDIKIRKYFNKPLFNEMTNFAGWSLLSSGASIITMQGTSIILNSFFGVFVNAAQGVTNQISGQLMVFSNTMLKALNPVIVKSEGGNERNRMLNASLFGNKISYLLLTFFSIPVILEMPFILDIWLKEVPNYTVVFCRLTLIRLSFAQLTITFATAIGATGNIRKYTFFRSMIFILLLPTSFFLFLLGASPIAMYISMIFMVIALLISDVYFTHKLCGLSISFFFKNIIIRCLFTSIFTAISVYIAFLFMQEGINRLLVVLIFNLLAFVFFGTIIAFTKKEKQQMISIITVGFNQFRIKLFK
jgi:O-antigen/teichoic acid export membrane protein